MNVKGYLNNELIGIFPDRRQGCQEWERSIESPWVRTRFVRAARRFFEEVVDEWPKESGGSAAL